MSANLAESGPQTWVGRIAESFGGNARATMVFGDAVERGGLTLIPVARVRYGVGGGVGGFTARPGGGEAGQGGGAGGGLRMEPIGWIEVRDGVSSFRPIVDAAALARFVVVGGLVTAVVLRRLRHLLPWS